MHDCMPERRVGGEDGNLGVVGLRRPGEPLQLGGVYRGESSGDESREHTLLLAVTYSSMRARVGGQGYLSRRLKTRC